MLQGCGAKEIQPRETLNARARHENMLAVRVYLASNEGTVPSKSELRVPVQEGGRAGVISYRQRM